MVIRRENYGTGMARDETDMIRVRLGEPLRNKWKSVLDARKISQQKAIVATIEWIVEQDALLQTMLFGQVPESDTAELAKIVLKRLPAKGGK